MKAPVCQSGLYCLPLHTPDLYSLLNRLCLYDVDILLSLLFQIDGWLPPQLWEGAYVMVEYTLDAVLLNTDLMGWARIWRVRQWTQCCGLTRRRLTCSIAYELFSPTRVHNFKTRFWDTSCPTFFLCACLEVSSYQRICTSPPSDPTADYRVLLMLLRCQKRHCTHSGDDAKKHFKCSL